MDNSGQLTFSDDPLLQGANEAYQLIEEGSFQQAAEKLDKLMNIDPEHQGLINGYRTAKFWYNREKELDSLNKGKKTADFLMKEWGIFDEYALSKDLTSSPAYKAAMRYVFYKASEHYKIAFQTQEDTTNNLDLLLNLGDCFLRLNEYKYTIETLEYARNSYSSNARLLSILGEAYFHENDLPKCLLYMREAFFIEPSEINLNLIQAKPILDLIEIVKNEKNECSDIREWVPIYGFTSDIFYVRRNLNKHQVETINKDIYNLEVSFQKMNNDDINSSNVLPRLLNKYLWMLDYYEFQNYSFENLAQIRGRLIKIEKNIFEAYFKNSKK